MEEKKIIREKKKVLTKYLHNGNGIVTGPHNPASVGTTVYVLDGGESAMVFTLNRYHEGHPMFGHGGITASILDETMGYSCHTREYVNHLNYTPVFTGTVTYKYIKPVEIGKKYMSFGRVKEADERRRFVEGEILDEDGNVYVLSEGVFITDPGVVDPNEHVAYRELTEDDPKEL